MKWKEFGYMNAYRVSEDGDIQSRLEPGGKYKRNVLGVWRDKRPSFKKSDYTGAGYLTTSVKFTADKFTPAYIHRLVAEHFCEKRDGCDHVDHINGDRLCNKAENLRWVTPQENMDNAKERGVLDGRGKYNGKLSIEQALTIITMINAGKTNKEISEEYQIDPSNISKIRNKTGTTYKELLHLVKNPRPRRPLGDSPSV